MAPEPLSKAASDAHQAALLVIEEAAKSYASAPLKQLALAIERIIASGRDVLNRLAELLGHVEPRKLVRSLTVFTDQAQRLGLARAQQTAGRVVPTRVVARPNDLRHAQNHAVEGLQRARKAAFAGEPEAIRGALGATINRVEGSAAWSVNEASAEAQLRVADQTGSAVLWQAERNACVYCLSRAGAFRAEDGTFGFGPHGSFAAKAQFNAPQSAPPLHPHCRCDLIVGPRPALTGLATAQAREAARSILRGDKLTSESVRQRIEAAKALLDRGGAGLPASVRKRAANAVKAGSFDATQARRLLAVDQAMKHRVKRQGELA